MKKVLAILSLSVSLAGCRRCILAHDQTVFVPRHTSWMMVGKVMIPMTYPEHYETDTVCDQYDK